MNRSFIKVACVGILLFLLLCTPPNYHAQAGDEIVIGSWNIQWLGTPKSRSDAILQNSGDLAVYIHNSNVDILALQEISDTVMYRYNMSSQPRTNFVLNQTFNLLNKYQKTKWKYKLFPKRRQGEKTQLTGIAWNEKKVKNIGKEYRFLPNNMPSSPRYWDRYATAIKIQPLNNKSDFLIVSVHMKANTGRNKTDKKKHILQREKEADYLVQSLDRLRQHYNNEKDIIIIGDTNILTAKESKSVLGNRSEMTAKKIANAGFTDLNDGKLFTTTPYQSKRATFDRAFVPKGQSEFSISKLDVYKPEYVLEDFFDLFYSDHYMIRLSVKLLNDDD